MPYKITTFSIVILHFIISHNCCKDPLEADITGRAKCDSPTPGLEGECNSINLQNQLTLLLQISLSLCIESTWG